MFSGRTHRARWQFTVIGQLIAYWPFYLTQPLPLSASLCFLSSVLFTNLMTVCATWEAAFFLFNVAEGALNSDLVSVTQSAN